MSLARPPAVPSPRLPAGAALAAALGLAAALTAPAFAADTIAPAAIGDLHVGYGAAGHVTVYPGNHRYPQDATGNPFVLIGIGNEAKNPGPVLAQLAGRTNYIRCYAASWDSRSDPSEYAMGRPYPAVNGVTDMNGWNETYWANLRDYLGNARQYGLTVGITLFDGHYDLPGGKIGSYSVWNSGNNAQGIQWAYDANALTQYPNPSPTGGASERLVYYQRRWVDRLLQEIAAFPNVILELDNETTGASSAWFLWWAAHIEASGPYVVATTGDANTSIPDNVFASDSRLHMKSYHSRDDGVIDAQRYGWDKIIVADADNSCTVLSADSARRLAWRSVVRGGHWNDFLCDAAPFSDTVKLDDYRHLLDFLRTADVRPWDMAPHTELVTSGVAMSLPGSRYLVYTETSVTVDLSAASGSFPWQWYDPRTGTTAGSGVVSGGAPRSFTIPSADDYVLWIAR